MSQLSLRLAGADPDVRSRLIYLGVRSKQTATPKRSLCLTLDSRSEAKVLRGNYQVTGINELPREIDKRKLEDIDSDREKQETFYRDIRYRFSGIDTASQITTFVLTYSNKERNERNRQPTSVETEYLCGLLNHPLNDIWVPPIIPELSGRAYIPYLKDFYSEVESYQRVAYAGLIPHIAKLEIRQLLQFYVQLGLNYFVMDFAGKNPLDLVGNINEAVRMKDLIEKQTDSVCFLHAVNVPITKAHWNTLVVPAKDIFLFVLGFNCFGSSHVRRQLPPEIAEKMSSTEKRPFRLFNRRDYGCYRDDAKGLKQMLEERQPVSVSFDDVSNGATWKDVGQLEKLFNVERHGLEADEIRTRLIDQQSVAKYIESKENVPSTYVKKMFGLSQRQSLL